MRPVKVRIEADGIEAARLLALAETEGLVLASPGEEADLIAKAAAAEPGASPAGPRASRGGLSRRELEILGYIVDGWSNAEIASALRLKVRTVRFHLEGVYAKLGVSRGGERPRARPCGSACCASTPRVAILAA